MTRTKKIQKFLASIDVENIADERKKTLQVLADYIQSKVNEGQAIRLNFICTHNSRRSHLAQIWAQTLAYYFGIKNTTCYSGGTEATALFPAVIETLLISGFQVDKLSDNENPVYSIKFADNELPIIGFSKTLSSDFNPKAEFCAIMTCSQADEACPFVPGAEKRVPITYDDPKVFDNTPQQAKKYDERSRQIATEMYYVFSKIQS